MKYVSLHSHSTLSYQDGYGMPADHVARVADLGMEALALTEHGNLSSVVKLDQAARKNGIQPIFGLEAYTGPVDMVATKNRRKWHQTILAATQQGYTNLMQLVARSWAEGFYQWPTVTFPMLRDHHEGLIVLSGCLDSKLACDLMGGKGREHGDLRDAEATLRAYKRLLGDRFYLEVQRFPQLERARQLNPQYEAWSAKFGVPLVATADCHYPMPADNKMQAILHSAGRHIKGGVEAAEAAWEYDVLLTYPESDEMVVLDLMGTGLSRSAAEQAVANTAEIASRCRVELPVMDRVRYPYELEGADSEEELLRRWLSEGWSLRRIFDLPPAERKRYHERVLRELGVFRSKDFLSYFLMIADATRFAKREGIAVGPGRGSAAGSLAMYLLQITEIDPMRFPLMMFERFVDPERMDLPDVDIDFEPARRDEVRRYLEQKYGAERVGNVGTFTYYRAKNSVDDVARVHNIPFAVAKGLKDLVLPEGLQPTLEAFPTVAETFDTYPDLRQALRLEGNIKGFGIHAAGLVVGAEPLYRYVTTYQKEVGSGKDKHVVSALSVDKYDLEQMGLLKIDALGLNTMGIIKTAAETVGMSMDEVYAIDLGDTKVLEGFRRGDVGGVFQFEGSTTRDICVEVAPFEFMDLAHINALSRPGPLYGGSTQEFIRSRQGRSRREPLHPKIEAILSQTEGEVVYQEQVIALAAEVGGFDSAGASRVRKIISKKLGRAAFDELWEAFSSGAEAQGISVDDAALVWQKMVTSGGYAFNVAHAVSYSVLAYWCMWFRVHHPVAFFYARLMGNDGDAAKTLDILKDMRSSTHIRLLKLSPQYSGATWEIDTSRKDSLFRGAFDAGTPSHPALRPGLLQVKGIGASLSETMVAWRRGLPETEEVMGWKDYAAVKGVGPGTIDKLEGFAADEDPFGVEQIPRETLSIKAWLDTYEMRHVERMPQVSKVASSIPYTEGRWSGTLLGKVREIKYRDVFESHKNRTGKDLDPATLEDPHLTKSASLFCEDVTGMFKVSVSRRTLPRYKDDLNDLVIDRDYLLVNVSKGNFPGKTVFANQLWVVDPSDEEEE